MHRLVFEIGYFIGLARVSWHNDTPSPLLERAFTSGWLKPGARVLEVGCGLGTNSEWLASRGLDVTAIDLSSVAVGRVRRQLERKGLHAKIYQADFLQGLQEEPFDAVFDRATLHAFPRGEQRAAFARRLAEQVKPGGLLLLAEMRTVPKLAHRSTPPFGVDRADLDAHFGETFQITPMGEELQPHRVFGNLPFAQWSLRHVGAPMAS